MQEKHIDRLDRTKFERELSKHGKDLFKDKEFFRDMSKETHLKISKLFANNTYLGKSELVNSSFFKVIPDEVADREIDEQRTRRRKKLNSDMNAIERVE